jgi:DNA-binding MarR family transcriptional regulator
MQGEIDHLPTTEDDRTTPSSADRSESLADLAQWVLTLARDIRLYGALSPSVVEITWLESLVMGHVIEQPGIALTQISLDLGVKSANTSAVLRALEKKGIITRTPKGPDGRSIAVHPTPFAAENAAAVRSDWTALLSKHVPDDIDLAPVIDVLQTVQRSLGRRTAADEPAHIFP